MTHTLNQSSTHTHNHQDMGPASFSCFFAAKYADLYGMILHV